jgi:hypothetical protein
LTANRVFFGRSAEHGGRQLQVTRLLKQFGAADKHAGIAAQTDGMLLQRKRLWEIAICFD